MIDQVQDTNGRYLYNLDQNEGLPDFVLKSNRLSKEASQLLGSNLFADQKNRLFPIQGKADTWLSAMYFEKFARSEYSDDELCDKVASKLKDMCAFWGFEYPEAIQQEKQACTEVEIEYRFNGVPQKTVTVRSGEQLEKVASFITEHPDKMPWETRRDAARQVLDKQASFADAIGEGLLASLHKTAGYGVGDSQTVLSEISKRQLYLQKAPNSACQVDLSPLTDLVKEGSQDGIVEPEVLDKVAAALDAVDKVLGLHCKYGSDLSLPENALFSFTLQDQELYNKEAVRLPSGQIVSESALEDYAVRNFMGGFLGETPQQGHAKEAAAQLTPRQSAKVYNHLVKVQVG